MKITFIIFLLLLCIPVFSENIKADNFEPDDTYEKAKEIKLNNETQKHNISIVSDVDWIKFKVNKDTSVKIECLAKSDILDINLYKKDDINNPISSGNVYSSIISKVKKNEYYFIKIISYNNNTGNYVIYIDESNEQEENKENKENNETDKSLINRMNNTPLTVDSFEDDNGMDKAKEIKLNESQNRNLHKSDDIDWIKFISTSTENQNIVFSCISNNDILDFYLFDKDGNSINNLAGNTNSPIYLNSMTNTTYFIKVVSYNSKFGEYTINVKLTEN